MADGGKDDPFDVDGTIGIEEEYFLVDDDGRPITPTEDLYYRYERPAILEDRLDHELFTFVIETQTPVIDDLDAAPDALTEIREALLDFTAEHGYGVAAAGLHPLAKWRELDHATKPRYRRQLDRIQYPQHRNTTAGLHVHIGVRDGDRAMWVTNELRWYLPLILALSANSPFWNGFDTGLASARARIFENLPNTGIPPAYPSLAAYRDLERTLLDTDSINDRGEIWFDVRPHTEYGTVEVRTPDAQHEEWRVMALVEYVARLVETLADGYDRLVEGEEIASVLADVHARWATPQADGRPAAERLELLDENKWRALRYGREAAFIVRDATGTIPALMAAEAEVDRLDLDRLPNLLAGESGADRQRQLLANGGTDALCDGLRL